MGQYYYIVNITNKQYIHPHRFGDGLKLLEFGCSGNGTMTALALLLADGNGRGGGDLRSDDPIIGSWAGDRIVVTGDYADEENFLEETEIRAWRDRSGAPDNEKPNLQAVAGELYEDISAKVIAAMRADRYLRETMRADLAG
jgi:hypothetical protein